MTPVAIFAAALESMTGPTFGPAIFQDYCAQHQISAMRTAHYISVDSLDRLNPELRSSNTMVLRLGQHGGGKTSFVLVKVKDSIEDFFFGDPWADTPVTDFEPGLTPEERFAFEALSPLGEKGLVNLAIASGAMAHFLGVDEPASRSAPAVGGHGTYTFEFRPRADLDQIWAHVNGQVEVDALYAGRRDGRPIMAVLEAKHGHPAGTTLAKHKLLYPLLALRQEIRQRFQCIPLYLRCAQDDATAQFWFAEVTSPGPLDAMSVRRVGRYRVALD